MTATNWLSCDHTFKVTTVQILDSGSIKDG